jgi:hypothetical protein
MKELTYCGRNIVKYLKQSKSKNDKPGSGCIKQAVGEMSINMENYNWI